MVARITEQPIVSPTAKPAWWAILNLLITLYGVVFKGWGLQPVVFIFWVEVIYSVIAALIRVVGAMDDRPFLDTIGQKIVFLFGGTALGIAFIMLSVTFTIGAFEGGFQTSDFAGIRNQVLLIALNYGAALVIHYFLNGRFRHANPAGELIPTFVHLLVLLVFIMVITMHLLPKFPNLNHALWAGLAVLLVKFAVDWMFSGLGRKIPQTFGLGS